MDYQVICAKDGNAYLQINGVAIYSKYNPKKYAEQFILSESEYIKRDLPIVLFGLGLGYHLEYLLKYFPDNSILVVYFEDTEYAYFKERKLFDSLNLNKVTFSKIGEQSLSLNTEEYNIILPSPWLKALKNQSPLLETLEEFKLAQVSYRRAKDEMENNFKVNVSRNNYYIENVKLASKIAFLVAAGPSLDTQFNIIKKYRNQVIVLAVATALTPLMNKGIVPDAIVSIDSSELTVSQIKSLKYKGILFYLSTANKEFVDIYLGDKIILFQKGFPLNEQYALEKKLQLINSGGSVATVALEILEQLNVEQVFLFGLDLGFQLENTHAQSSTSNQFITNDNHLLKVEANNGQMIKTTVGFSSFRKWIEKKAATSKMRIYNLSINGAKIKNVPFLGLNDFNRKMNQNNLDILNEKINLENRSKL